MVGDTWGEGQFSGRYEQLLNHCESRYQNFGIHKGLFKDTLTPQFLDSLQESIPILVWIDCDFYSSTRVVFERLPPFLPTGCVFYFDDYELLNYGSRFTGEARLVAEVNAGVFGAEFELVHDQGLSMNSKRCYRFVRVDQKVSFSALDGRHTSNAVRALADGSLLP